MQTNSVSAEFGRLGGGVINLVTKSGTNTFRATGFGFMRNSKFDATNFFTNRAGQKKGEFKRNQFGGNFGGPVALPGYKGATARSSSSTTKACARSAASVSTLTVPLPGVAHRRLLEPAELRAVSRSSSTIRRRRGPIPTTPGSSSAIRSPAIAFPPTG